MTELDETLNRWRSRLEELEPSVQEAGRLQAAITALARGAPLPEHRRPPAIRSERPAAVLAAVGEHPGLTPVELAEASGIPITTLRAVMPSLKNQGFIQSHKRRWYVVSEA